MVSSFFSSFRLTSSQFPDGEMITKLYPLLVVNPLCVDLDGAPISYESYAFSPRQVRQCATDLAVVCAKGCPVLYSMGAERAGLMWLRSR